MTSSSVPVVIDGRTLSKAQPPDLMRSDLMLASFFLVGFALLLFAIAGFSALWDRQWRSTALRAEGEVLELRGTSSPIARVRFTDAQGLEHIADTSGPFNGVHAEAGERIVILYQPGSPTYASHDDPARNWIGTAIFAGGGCLPLLLIPFMRRQLRRQEQRYARLRQLGYRRQVESVRTQPVQLGKVRRWAVIASWRDSLGRPHKRPSPAPTATTRHRSTQPCSSSWPIRRRRNKVCWLRKPCLRSAGRGGRCEALERAVNPLDLTGRPRTFAQRSLLPGSIQRWRGRIASIVHRSAFVDGFVRATERLRRGNRRSGVCCLSRCRPPALP